MNCLLSRAVIRPALILLRLCYVSCYGLLRLQLRRDMYKNWSAYACVTVCYALQVSNRSPNTKRRATTSSVDPYQVSSPQAHTPDLLRQLTPRTFSKHLARHTLTRPLRRLTPYRFRAPFTTFNKDNQQFQSTPFRFRRLKRTRHGLRLTGFEPLTNYKNEMLQQVLSTPIRFRRRRRTHQICYANLRHASFLSTSRVAPYKCWRNRS